MRYAAVLMRYAAVLMRYAAILAIIGVTTSLVVTGPSLAMAKSSGRQPAAGRTASAASEVGSYADPYWGRRGDYLCRRWCLGDRTPCDTVTEKAADGRCEGDARSFYGVLICRVGDHRPACPQ